MKKKQILLVLCLCVALVVATACQGGGAGPDLLESLSPESEISSQTSEPQEEASTALPATLPEDTTELTVPLQMVEPGADVFPSGEEWSYSTQGDEDVCRQWLYDLKAEDITALYGEVSPLDYYWTGEMSMEDSRWVVDLLRSVAPDLTPLESGNPYTGGGWTIALYTEDEAVGFGFNGGWFTFAYQGTVWIFNAENAPVQESCNDIGGILSSYGSKGHGPTAENPVTDDLPTERYFGDDVQAIYAVDRDNYVMAEVKDGYASSKAIWEGLQNRVPSDGEPSGYGYLIITDEGKEYVYMDTEEVALNKYCQAALIAGPLHPSWLIHMTPERMVSVDIMGFDEPITDRDQLLELAEFLKEEVTVQPEVGIHSGILGYDTPATLWFWKITFDSGVEYRLFGYDNRDGTGDLTIYTTDLDTTVMYQLNEGAAGKITTLEGRAERYDWW